MATTRLELINRARISAGPRASTVNLNNEFDYVTRRMTNDYPILNHYCLEGKMMTDRNYINLPSDYRSWEQLILDATEEELEWYDPPDFFMEDQDTSSGTPSIFTIVESDSKIYLWPAPSSALAYKFYYARLHPQSTGDTYTHLMNSKFDPVIVAGLTAYACEKSDQFEKAIYFWQRFEEMLPQYALVATRTYMGAPYVGF